MFLSHHIKQTQVSIKRLQVTGSITSWLVGLDYQQQYAFTHGYVVASHNLSISHDYSSQCVCHVDVVLL